MQLRVIMCCCMWCSTWLFWRLGPMIIYLPAWSSFVPRIFSTRSSYSASLHNHISIKTWKLCNDLFAWTKQKKKKRDLRIVFTVSCADLLRHGLLMLMFLDGTCQASELDGSSTLILFMISMVILTTPWELCSRSTPKKKNYIQVVVLPIAGKLANDGTWSNHAKCSLLRQTLLPPDQTGGGY